MSEIHPAKKLLMIPGPTNVSDRVMRAMVKPMISHKSEEFHELLASITEKGKGLFQTKENLLTLTASGTGGVEAMVFALVRPGDNVVVPLYGDFSQRLVEALEIAGARVVRVTAEAGRIPRLEDVEDAIRKTEKLKAIYAVHNETSTGCAIPYLKELAEAAHARGAFMVVDGVSSIGGYSVPVDDWGIDMCVTASQKCIAAPPGVVLLAFNKSIEEFVKKTPPVVRYFDLAKHLEFLEHGFTAFTPAVSLFYAVEEALAELKEETLQKRVARHADCARQLYSWIESAGLSGLAEKECRSNTVITITYPKGVEDERFRKVLDEDHGVVTTGGFGPLRGKILRVGSMGNVTAADIKRTTDSISETFSALGHPIDSRAPGVVSRTR